LLPPRLEGRSWVAAVYVPLEPNLELFVRLRRMGWQGSPFVADGGGFPTRKPAQS
jgi:hypothetical protein